MADLPPAADPGGRVLVWDLPTRVFHWLLAAVFAAAWLSGEADGWLVTHAVLGYTMLGLVAFRLVWGVVGTRYARFGSFAFGARAVAGYLRSLLTRHPQHHLGHNPAGSWAVYALLALSLLAGASGWLTLQVSGSEWLEELHEGLASLLLMLVFVHIGGVVLASLRHRENLVRAMVDGRKRGAQAQAVRRPLAPVAALLMIVVLVFWIAAMSGALPALTQPAADRARHADRGD